MKLKAWNSILARIFKVAESGALRLNWLLLLVHNVRIKVCQNKKQLMCIGMKVK